MTNSDQLNSSQRFSLKGLALLTAAVAAIAASFQQGFDERSKMFGFGAVLGAASSFLLVVYLAQRFSRNQQRSRRLIATICVILLIVWVLSIWSVNY